MSWHRPAGTLVSESDPVRLTPADAGWIYCGLHVVALAAGEQRSIELGDAEGAVVPLSGRCRVEGDGFGFDLRGRDSVFSAVTDLCYVPLGAQVSLSSATGGRFAVATAIADETRPARYLPADGVTVDIRGAGQASRQISELLSADVEGPQRLIVVEVLTPEGNWSSYPPHKHDEWSEHEVPLEEIYYFRVDGPPGGFGLHRTYTDDRAVDDTVTVRDGDVYLIPRGYHGPCVAAPGHELYYLNVMAGPDEQRRWSICTDPAHDWLWNVWADMAPDARLPLTTARGRA